ncbi:winged helix-turn-helix domain-containing protein [Acidimicrobiia bacterium EGI L10123]|uniref:BTAD domain-containing putative transcriptional regulator n=1 Tax=Salinilacustrithrix flava TaxID=2957203 RepID=UPI003D7C1DDE|nr:winged helix-turn-helix domain-containing protein [Acidimicrobiia bacterium EGI L10123]
MDRYSFHVLGALQVVDTGDGDVTPRGALQRRLLATLLLHRGQVVSADALAEVLWPDELPSASGASLQSQVYRLRQHLSDLAIEHRASGYVLDVADESVDAHRFERAVPAAAAVGVDDPQGALDALDEALGRWRGTPYEELGDTDDGRIEAERLAELRCRAMEERFAALLRLGRADEVTPDLEAFVARAPLRERPRELLMEALDATGRRAEALRVYDAYRRVLAEELGVEPSAHLAAHHEQLLAGGAPATAPPPAQQRPRVPRPVSSFVGRDDLLDLLEHQVARHRMVTLVGPGGVGKTRLAVELVHRLAGEFPDGVRFCDLTGIADDSEVVPAVAATVGVEPRAGVDPVDRLADVLRHERTLILLDNCEHVLDGAATLAEGLLTSVEGVAVVATSREPLTVDGERTFPVPTLACDGEGAAATALFLDRAAAAQPSFVVDAGNRKLVDQLCERLDGLPLAIELAAARLRSLSLEEIVAGLEAGTSVLRGGRRTTPRHRSLAAALEWSYRSLDADDRSVLSAAAQFAGAFDADDIAFVSDRSPHQVRERLADLVERSLVARVGERFRLLQVISGFVLEQVDDDDRARLARRHAQQVTARADEAKRTMAIGHDDRGMERIRELVPDLRRAVATAVADADVELARRIVLAGNTAALNGMIPEFNAWGEVAGRLAEDAGHPDSAELYAIAARGAWKTGDLEGMRALLERAGDTLEATGAPPGYEYLTSLGVEALAKGELAQGVEWFREGIAAAGQELDWIQEAEAGGTLVITAAYAHLPEAHDEVARLLRDVVPHAGAVAASWCWYAAGECLLDDDPDEARVLLERAVELARAGGSPFVQGVAGASLASLDVRAGDVAAAIERYRWLFPLWLRAGVRSPMRTMLRTVTELLCRHGAHEHAARLLGAVTASGVGHEVVGDDDRRLTAVRQELDRRLGPARCAELVSEGCGLDDAAAAAEATAAFELLS